MAEDQASRVIPAMRPLLPSSEAIAPYLAEIDSNRWYTNRGPLLERLEARLADHVGVDPDNLVCVANGTLALSLALRAQHCEAGTYCAMPSWTFVATPAAALQAGLRPWFLDINAHDWQLKPDLVCDALRAAPGPVSSVIPVAPFGAPIDMEAWDRFAEETGLAVVIDAAAGFDSVRPGRVPVMVSLHATKTLGSGEGGFVMTHDATLAAHVRAISQFGFAGHRNVTFTGYNAKMSEYTAAVGLAALDGWPDRRAAYLQRARAYRDHLVQQPGLAARSAASEKFATSTYNVVLEAPIADRAIDVLRGQGIEARQWWDKGCHRKPAYADAPRHDLSITETLAEKLVSLPFSPDMSMESIEFVAQAIAAVADSGNPTNAV